MFSVFFTTILVTASFKPVMKRVALFFDIWLLTVFNLTPFFFLYILYLGKLIKKKKNWVLPSLVSEEGGFKPLAKNLHPDLTPNHSKTPTQFLFSAFSSHLIPALRLTCSLPESPSREVINLISSWCVWVSSLLTLNQILSGVHLAPPEWCYEQDT